MSQNIKPGDIFLSHYLDDDFILYVRKEEFPGSKNPEYSCFAFSRYNVEWFFDTFPLKALNNRGSIDDYEREHAFRQLFSEKSDVWAV